MGLTNSYIIIIQGNTVNLYPVDKDPLDSDLVDTTHGKPYTKFNNTIILH